MNCEEWKKAFEITLKYLDSEYYDEITDEDTYISALKNEDYNVEWIQDLKVLRKAYLKLKTEQ